MGYRLDRPAERHQLPKHLTPGNVVVFEQAAWCIESVDLVRKTVEISGVQDYPDGTHFYSGKRTHTWQAWTESVLTLALEIRT